VSTIHRTTYCKTISTDVFTQDPNFLCLRVRIRSGFRYRINSGDSQHYSKTYPTLSQSACTIILRTVFLYMIVIERAQDYHCLSLFLYDLMSLVHNCKMVNLHKSIYFKGTGSRDVLEFC
jgi:hypothetical protein